MGNSSRLSREDYRGKSSFFERADRTDDRIYIFTRFLLIQTELFPSVLMVAFSFPDRTGLFKLRPRSVGQSVSNRVLRTKLTIVR